MRFCQQDELNEQDELDELNELNEQDELNEQEDLNEQDELNGRVSSQKKRVAKVVTLLSFAFLL